MADARVSTIAIYGAGEGGPRTSTIAIYAASVAFSSPRTSTIAAYAVEPDRPTLQLVADAAGLYIGAKGFGTENHRIYYAPESAGLTRTNYLTVGVLFFQGTLAPLQAWLPEWKLQTGLVRGARYSYVVVGYHAATDTDLTSDVVASVFGAIDCALFVGGRKIWRTDAEWSVSSLLTSIRPGCSILGRPPQPPPMGGDLHNRMGILVPACADGSIAGASTGEQEIEGILTLDPNMTGAAPFLPHYGQEDSAYALVTHASETDAGVNTFIAQIVTGLFTPGFAPTLQAIEIVSVVDTTPVLVASVEFPELVDELPYALLAPWFNYSFNNYSFPHGFAAHLRLRSTPRPDLAPTSAGRQWWQFRVWLNGTLVIDTAHERASAMVAGTAGIGERTVGGAAHWSSVNGTFACQGAPCAVTLEVYDDDRTTILWEVGTNPAHANPYLCLPENYGEQEIDVVRGAATIGQVEAVIIDRRQTAGDQDSGWLTDKLADRIHGRRCRMRRFVSEDIGWVTIADGPAGTPRLDASFAAYHFVIRDTRETERKVRAFVTSDTTSLLPLGITNGFGLIPAVTPLSGPYITGLPAANALIDFAPGYWTGTVGVDAVVDDAVVISAEHEAMVQATRVEDIGGGQFRNHYDNVKLLWRIAGSMAAYTEWATPVGTYSDDTARPLVAVFDALKVTGQPVRAAFVIQSDAIPGAPALDTEDLEVIIVPVDAQPTSSQWPLHIDGLTAGEFLTNLYDGLYSPRDSSGNIVPTGIRYDAAALLAMTTQVTLRVTEPIDDARAWAEEFIYAPTGWCPALDNDARISPVSQIPPLSTAGLTDINGAITEPVPGWHAGERVINIVEYEYPRHYIPADSSVPVDGDGLATRTQRITDTTLLHSETSIERHGEQKVDFNGLAFAAIGSGIGEPLGYPQDPDAIQTELGYQLAYERGLYILPRYEEGAQAIDVPVMRSATATLRAGDWVLANLAWFPNYITRRRGQTDMIGQIMAIADLDCAWRQLLIEEGPPTIPPADVELEDSVGVWDELDVVSITPVDLEDTAGVDETLDIIAEITVEDAFAPSLLPPAFVAVRTNQSETPTSLYRYSIEIFDNTDPIELEFYVKIAGVWQLEDTITFLTAGRHDINIPPVGSVGDPDVEEFRILDLNVQEPIAWTAIGVSWTYQTPIASL